MSNPAVEDLKSIKARGQIGHQSIYYVVNGVQKKRAYAVPTDPKTQAQIDRRNLFASGMEFWKSQEQAYRDEYNQNVKDPFRKMWGVNLFMSEVLRGIIEVSQIKSIQGGRPLIAHGTNNIAIASVDMSKSFAIVGTFSINLDSSNNYWLAVIGGRLTSNTNLEIMGIHNPSSGNVYTYYQVIEFY